MKVIIFIVALIHVVIILAQGPQFNPCISKITCHECIQTPSCAWCTDPNFRDQVRCHLETSYSALFGVKCKDVYIWNPYNTLYILKNRQLSKARSVSSETANASSIWTNSNLNYPHSSSSSSSSSQPASTSHSQSDIIQISPQHVGLKVRIREPIKITMNYTRAEDFPLDIYLIMDLTGSMESNKHKLDSLGNLIHDSVRNITKNFRLGVGSLVTPCQNCSAPYVFQNIMSLSHDTNEFVKQIAVTPLSTNSSATDGTLAAIMQAVVCKNHIGWRQNARKVLLFATANSFHFRSNQNLDDNIKTNDGLCHLDNSGKYSYSSIQSNPSISQINLKVREHTVNIIFAATAKSIASYKRFQNYIEGASTGLLSTNSFNVIDLIEDLYWHISSSVEMKDNATGDIKVTYYSRCLNYDLDHWTKQINVGDVVTFNIEIEARSCPRDPKQWVPTLQIYTEDLEERLIVDLEMLCSCPCEKPTHPTYGVNAPECHGFGTIKCGICECNLGYFGRRCECMAPEKYLATRDLTLDCRPDNKTTLVCSGRGSCICGVCDCEIRHNEKEVISGEYCECDNFSCNRHRGELCSGPDHGQCVCGKCVCFDSWGGPACSCLLSEDLCYFTGSNGTTICSGHGVCECGRCKCFEDGQTKYSGEYCEKHLTY